MPLVPVLAQMEAVGIAVDRTIFEKHKVYIPQRLCCKYTPRALHLPRFLLFLQDQTVLLSAREWHCLHRDTSI